MQTLQAGHTYSGFQSRAWQQQRFNPQNRELPHYSKKSKSAFRHFEISQVKFPTRTKDLMKYHKRNIFTGLITQFLFLPSLLRAIIISWQITLIISWSSAGLFLRINCWSARYNWLQLCCTTSRKNNQTVHMK